MISLQSTSVLLGALCLSVTAVAAPDSPESTPPAIKRWVEARAGSSEPVHWVSEGAVYAYPSGEKLFGMIGFDSSRVVWPEQPGEEIVHLTRKTFTYTHPETGEVLDSWEGQEVVPIAYPYQLITYRYENNLIYADVEQGREPNVQHIQSNDGIIARRIGEDTWAYTASIFLDFPLAEGRRYQAWENYDFFIQPDDGSVDEPHQMSWQRYGDLPPWAGEGKAIYHLLSWRVESTDEFPTELLEWARENKPQWLAPPASIEEVRTLQKKGMQGMGW